MRMRKKIFVNTKRTRWVWVWLYSNKQEMQENYERNPLVSLYGNAKKNDKILGAHCPYTRAQITSEGKRIFIGEIGRVYLCYGHVGAGIVAHEFGHAILWAFKHRPFKKQYPIVIRDMRYEEELLHNLTEAVAQFYSWYWKIEKKIAKHAI